MITTGAGEVKALDGFVYIGVIVRESWLQKNRSRGPMRSSGAMRAVHDPATTEKARAAVKATRRVRRAFFDDLGRQTVLPEDHRLSRDGGRIVNFVNGPRPSRSTGSTEAAGPTTTPPGSPRR
jgi:NitT/TauT family transport system substrate-binding protein